MKGHQRRKKLRDFQNDFTVRPLTTPFDAERRNSLKLVISGIGRGQEHHQQEQKPELM
jgi:hypothetical protein